MNKMLHFFLLQNIILSILWCKKGVFALTISKKEYDIIDHALLFISKVHQDAWTIDLFQALGLGHRPSQ